MLAVFHSVFQAWQYNTLSEGDHGVDIGPKKVPDKPVLRTFIRFELGEESKLGQHNVAHAQVALVFGESVEIQTVARAILGLQQLFNDLTLILGRSFKLTSLRDRYREKLGSVAAHRRDTVGRPRLSQPFPGFEWAQRAGASPTATPPKPQRRRGRGPRAVARLTFPEVEATAGGSGPRDHR